MENKEFSLNELLSFIDWLDWHFKSSNDIDDEKRILYRTVKVSEEVWELSDAVMSYLWNQRKEKLEGFSKDHLDEEVVDIIIATLILAKSLNVDIEQTMRKKIQKVKNRHNG